MLACYNKFGDFICFGINIDGVFIPLDNVSFPCSIMIPIYSGIINFIDSDLNERFLGVLSTKENVNLGTLGFEKTDCAVYRGVITPIVIAGERLGTLFLYHRDGSS